ncbi:MAG: hypothetical protein V2A58_09055 [Planctomycetota bacterium]
MVSLRFLAALVLVLVLAHPLAAGEIRSDQVAASFDAKWSLKGIGSEPGSFVAELVGLRIADPTGGVEVEDSDVPAATRNAGEDFFTVGKHSEKLSLDYTHECAAKESLASTFTLTNLTDTTRCVEIEYRFRLRDRAMDAFIPGEGDFEGLPQNGKLVASYIAGYVGKNLVVPLVTLYSADAGFTACAELVTPIPSFAVSAERKPSSVELIVSRTRLRLDGRGSRTVTTHFFPHAGCWRPGLGFARSHWPELFQTREGAERLQVRGNGGGGLASYYPYDGADEKFWQSYNMKNNPWGDGFSMPYLFAWFGNYYFTELGDEWAPRAMTKWYDIHQHPEHYPAEFLEGKPAEDANWLEILKWLNSRSVDWELFQKFRHTPGMPEGAKMWAKFSHARVKEFLALAKKHGIVTMAYWNPCEVWDNWALDVFAGYEVPGWHHYEDCTLCNIHPDSPVEKVYWEKAKAIIDDYEDLTGLHVDQAYYGWEDRRRDDGFSIDERGPFSDLHRNIGRFVRKVTEYAHSKGKYTDQNHPQASIEVSGWCDVACVEDRCSPGLGQEIGRYGTIGSRTCIQLYPIEERMQINLRNGWFTNMGVAEEAYLDVKPRSTSYWLSRLYPPVFDLFRGRQWVLEPKCLELPEGYDGNLFVRGDGNYVATIISYGEHTSSPWWHVAVPVTIRIADAPGVKAAYQLSADFLGPRKIPFSTVGDTISISLPVHKSASAVVLARSGRFVTLDRYGFRAGTQNLVPVILDNFTDEPWEFSALVTYPGNNYKLSAHVLPGGTESAPFYADNPRTGATAYGFFRFRIHMDPEATLPMPEEKERHIATFEIADENPVAAFLAPSQPLVQRDLSNSTQGGYRPYWEAFPLHIGVGEQGSFEIGVLNVTDDALVVKLAASAKGADPTDPPTEMSVAAHEAKSVPLSVVGTTPGAGELSVTFTATGTQARRSVAFQVFGTALSEADVGAAKSVTLIADIWGQTSGSRKKPIYLNNAAVGALEGGAGYRVWTTRVRTKLSDEALKALRVKNAVRIENPEKESFKIRRAMIEIVTSDSRTFLLEANPVPVSYATELVSQAGGQVEREWRFAEGRLIKFGEPINLVFPAR